MLPARRRAALVRALMFGALLLMALVYGFRAYRVLAVAGDSAELMTAGTLWGVPHAPGYPLYTLILYLASSARASPFVLHLTSAFLHAAALAFVAGAIDIATGSIVAAVTGAAILALGRVFFLGSLYAEVFPLNDLLFAWLLYLAMRVRRDARWASLAVALGLGMAHHPMIVLAWPALAVIVGPDLVREVRGRRWRGLELAALMLAPVMAAYALVPWAASRDPYLSWGDVHDFGSLVHLVTRQDYSGPFRASRKLAEGQLLERLDAFGAATFASFGPLGSALVVAGGIMAWRRDRRVGGALVLAALFTGPIFAAANAFDVRSAYRVAFFERFFSMCHVALAVLAGFGVAEVEAWLRTRSPSAPIRSAALAALVAFALGPLVPNAVRLDMSSNRLGLAYAHDLVDSTPDASLVLLKGDMPTQAALYACGVEHRCGDRIVFAPGQLALPWRRRQLARRYPELGIFAEGDTDAAVAQLIDREIARRPVLVHEELVEAAVAGGRAAVPSGLLFRIYPSADVARADASHLLDRLERFSRGEGCEGCKVRESPHPLDDQLVRAYDTALRANASAARELGPGAHL